MKGRLPIRSVTKASEENQRKVTTNAEQGKNPQPPQRHEP